MNNKILLTLLLMTLCTSCSVIWNALNRNSLDKDMHSILKKCNITVDKSSARMIGTTRNAIFIFNGTMNDIKKIQKHIKIKEIVINQNHSNQTEEARLFFYYHMNFKKLKEYKRFNHNETKYFSSKRRFKIFSNKKIQHSGFEFFIIYYNPKKNEILIFTSYAYG